MTRVFLFIGLPVTPFTTNQSAKIVQPVSAKSCQGSTYQWQHPPFPPGCTFRVILHWDKGSGLCTPATTTNWILTTLRKWGQNMDKVVPSMRAVPGEGFGCQQLPEAGGMNTVVLIWAPQSNILYNTLKLEERSYHHHPHCQCLLNCPLTWKTSLRHSVLLTLLHFSPQHLPPPETLVYDLSLPSGCILQTYGTPSPSTGSGTW